jgi:fluoride ion exporter CrcB/FEX
MMIMADGTNTAMGSQIAAAIGGYFVGLACANMSYVCGTHVSLFFRSIQQSSVDSDDDIEVDSSNNPRDAKGCHVCSDQHIPTCIKLVCGIYFSPFLLFAIMLTGFLVGDVIYNINFYRIMWLITLFAPLGSLLRWRLARWNRRVWISQLHYIPWGTLIANIVACIVASLAEVYEERIRSHDESSLSHTWSVNLLVALRSGFAGSLSTVSTLVYELYHMKELQHSYTYGSITLLLSMLLSFAVYGPLVRVM